MHNRSLNLLTRCLWSLSQVIVCCAHRRLHLFHLLIRANAAFGYPAGVFKSGAKASWPWSASNLHDPTANAVTDIASKDLVVSLHTPRPHHLSGGGKPGGPQAPPPPPIQRLLLSAWQPSAVGLVCRVRREGRDGEGARRIRHLLPWCFTGSLPGRSDCRGTHPVQPTTAEPILFNPSRPIQHRHHLHRLRRLPSGSRASARQPTTPWNVFAPPCSESWIEGCQRAC